MNNNFDGSTLPARTKAGLTAGTESQMFNIVDFGLMLSDLRRIASFRKALSECISPSSVVLDLGTGLGTFGIMACQLGAARVYAVEASDVISVAQDIARANYETEQMHFIQARVAEVELPEKVDVIISDLAGALPIFEQNLSSVIRARDHLKPGGVLIPGRARLFCAPISSSELYSSLVEPWHSVPGIDFSIAKMMVLNTFHARQVKPQHIVAEPTCWAEFDYAVMVSPNAGGVIEWQLPAPHVIHGVALWFEYVMYGDITYSSGPWFPESVHPTLVLPLLAPLDMSGGDTLRLSIDATLVAGSYVYTWQVGDGERQSTFLSEPLSRKSFVAQQDDAQIVSAAQEATVRHAPLRVSDRVLSRQVGDEVMLLNLSTGSYHALNESGTRVWELLIRGIGLTSIIETVVTEYDVDTHRAAQDVIALISRLQQHGVIRGVEDGL